MKVLYTLDTLNRGGAETLVLDICKNASRFGISPYFVAFGGGALEVQFRSGNFPAYWIERRAPLDLKLVFHLRRLLRREAIDIVHCSQPVEAIHIYLASFGTRTKCVQTHHGVFPEMRNKIAARLISPLIDANIYVSKSLREWLESELRLNTQKTFYLVHNAVDESRLEPTGRDIRKELGIGPGTEVLGNLGNFLPTARKAQLTICKAFFKVISRNREVAFIFAGRTANGGEEYRDRCVAYCEEKGILDRVFFLGERTDIPDILHSLDLYVSASLAEGLPLAVIEAMLAKVPVILSDIEEHLEVSDNARCAHVFPVGDPDKLAEAIIDQLDDKKKRDSLASRGREFAYAAFTMEAHFKVLKKIYKGLLNKA